MVGLIAAGALAVGAGGAAIGVAAGGDNEPTEELAAAINKNEGTNLTAADLREAMEDVFQARLAEAVTAGRLTQAQADEMLERFREAPQRRAEHEKQHAARIAPVATLLGMSADEIRDARRDGTSLAKLAESKNVSRDKLLAAIKEGITAAGALEGVTYSAERLTEMAEEMADSTRGPGGRGGPGGHGGLGGMGGLGLPFGP
jgi:hypothetical protein